MSRTKDQWIEATGGFRLGESPKEFSARAARISRLEKQLKAKPSMELVEAIRREKGLTLPDEFDYTPPED
jgi:hypothetical protein